MTIGVFFLTHTCAYVLSWICTLINKEHTTPEMVAHYDVTAGTHTHRKLPMIMEEKQS